MTFTMKVRETNDFLKYDLYHEGQGNQRFSEVAFVDFGLNACNEITFLSSSVILALTKLVKFLQYDLKMNVKGFDDLAYVRSTSIVRQPALIAMIC